MFGSWWRLGSKMNRNHRLLCIALLPTGISLPEFLAEWLDDVWMQHQLIMHSVPAFAVHLRDPSSHLTQGTLLQRAPSSRQRADNGNTRDVVGMFRYSRWLLGARKLINQKQPCALKTGHKNCPKVQCSFIHTVSKNKNRKKSDKRPVCATVRRHDNAVCYLRWWWFIHLLRVARGPQVQY